jgi:hypothetical protein
VRSFGHDVIIRFVWATMEDALPSDNHGEVEYQLRHVAGNGGSQRMDDLMSRGSDRGPLAWVRGLPEFVFDY